MCAGCSCGASCESGIGLVSGGTLFLDGGGCGPDELGATGTVDRGAGFDNGGGRTNGLKNFSAGSEAPGSAKRSNLAAANGLVTAKTTSTNETNAKISTYDGAATPMRHATMAADKATERNNMSCVPRNLCTLVPECFGSHTCPTPDTDRSAKTRTAVAMVNIASSVQFHK